MLEKLVDLELCSIQHSNFLYSMLNTRAQHIFATVIDTVQHASRQHLTKLNTMQLQPANTIYDGKNVNIHTFHKMVIVIVEVLLLMRFHHFLRAYYFYDDHCYSKQLIFRKQARTKSTLTQIAMLTV